jgi:hypothetical protein
MDDRVICGKFYQGHNDRDGIDGQPVQEDGVGVSSYRSMGLIEDLQINFLVLFT